MIQLTTSQRAELKLKLASIAKNKEWEEARTKVELLVHEMMPHYGLFIERQVFENDEGNYQPVTKYALFRMKERISPWYWEVWTLHGWIKQQKHIIRAYIHIQHQLHSHRHPSERFLRAVHD